MMLERAIYAALDDARSFIQKEPHFIDEFFQGQGLQASEAAQIRKYWQNQSFWRRNFDNSQNEKVVGVQIAHQFPRGENPDFPGWYICLMDEKDAEPRFLGDELDDVVIDGELVSLTGAFKQVNISVFTYATNPDVCLYYHNLLEFFLMRNRSDLKKVGLLDSAFSAGDVMPDPRYGPDYVFIRRFGIEGMVVRAVRDGTQPARGKALGGVYLRNSEGLDIVTDGTDQDGIARSIDPQVTPNGGES